MGALCKRAAYESMTQRLLGKGERYKAVKEGNLHAYLSDAYSNKDFENERFESSINIRISRRQKIPFMNISILLPHYKTGMMTAYTLAQIFKYKGEHNVQSHSH